MSCLFMDEADNTDMCGASTPEHAENTQEDVVIVLDSKRRRRLRRIMTRKPTYGLGAIKSEHLRAACELAKINRGLSQEQIALAIGCPQQTISALTLGKIQGGEWKLPLVRFLAPELWQTATERNIVSLIKILRDLGLQLKDDDVMTLAQNNSRAVGVPGYTFDLYEPRLAREEGIMVFPSQPTAKTLPPNFAHSPQSYAFKMVGDSLQPFANAGEEVFVDPSIAPQIGNKCVFLSADRSRTRAGMLVAILPDFWRIARLDVEAYLDLPISEWPICEKIVGVHCL